jgi:maltooligosyltrehalose trehalohydrolase
LTPDHPLGATRVSETEWSFLVWAPAHQQVSLRVYDENRHVTHVLAPVGRGYHGAIVEVSGDAPTYEFELSDGAVLADPVSRWQPDGVHGRSRGFDPTAFTWSDAGFAPAALSHTVIYEVHIGTFTSAGTFDAAIGRLDDLAELGVTAIEPMPVAAFPGLRNWGYDGVFPFAVQDSYGGPAGFQRFVDACHARGLAVILDVVYNHLGPEGNVLGEFGPYFTDVYATPWGAAVNVSEAGSDEVRRYFTDNAVQWLRDFHVDGLRLDAIHGIVDPTASPFLRELTIIVGTLAVELDRRLLLIAESADNNPQVITPAAAGGLGFDGQWNDDFHHSLHALLTGERQGYYQDYGRVDQLARAFNDGFVYEGEHSEFRGRRHGAPSGAIPKDRFVVFSQNHDQVGNRAGAERLGHLVTPPVARLAAAAVLLSPFVPLLFMGEEYAEAAPFPYFIDHGAGALIDAVRSGRAAEFGRDADTFDPAAASTYERARLDWSLRDGSSGRQMLELYRDLIAARTAHPVLTQPDAIESSAVPIGPLLTVLRRSSAGSAFVALNLGSDDTAVRIEAGGQRWRLVLDAADPRFGGEGTRCPAGLEAGDVLSLSAYGFCLYVSSIVAQEGRS